MANLIEFKLFAPRNKAAAPVGSFSNCPIPMQKGKDGYFRALVELEDGTHQYKFRVQSKSWSSKPDEWVEVNDPYAKEIDSETQSSLIQVEQGKPVVAPYRWQYDDQPLPDNHELVIYEIFIADFSGGEADPFQRGTYQDVIDKLDYLSDLGINAIELMPVNDCGEAYSWGYLPVYFFANQTTYGSLEKLKQLVDECHSRGIRVILDQVYNHSSENSPLLKIDRDYWYFHDRHYPENSHDYWGPELNYDNYDQNLQVYPTRQFIEDVARYWIQEFHIDGIRYDAVKLINNDEYLKQLTDVARSAAGEKPFYNIGECVPERPSVVRPEGAMDACWHDSFCHFLLEHLSGKTFDLDQLKQVLQPERQGYPPEATKLINFISNHDQNQLMADLGEQNIFDQEAFQRIKCGTALLMTAVGVPMLWMGQEIGEYKSKATNAPNKIDWTVLKNQSNQDLLQYNRKLIALRKQNVALQSNQIEFFYEDPAHRVLAYLRKGDGNAKVVVIVNFSEQKLINYRIQNFPQLGRWCEWLKNEVVEIEDTAFETDLASFEARVFVQC